MNMYLLLVPTVFAALYGMVVIPPRRWAKHTSGGLIGERRIENSKDAHQLAKEVVAEAFALWDERNWEVMHNASNLVVEARRITEGPFKTSGILLHRADGVVEGANPDELFRFLTSVEGLLLLDPALDPAEAAKYMERYDWKGRGSRLDVHESFTRDVPPGMKERYYITLNGYDYSDRFFFCKSIVHDARPGSSPYYEAGPVATEDPRVRAVNTFYFRMTPTRGGTRVQMINYADVMMGSTLMNWKVGKLFFPSVYDKLRERFSNDVTKTS